MRRMLRRDRSVGTQSGRTQPGSTQSVFNRPLRLERLDARQLMAADMIHSGAFCTEWSDATLAASSVIPAASISPTASVTTAAAKAKPSYSYSIIGDPTDSPAVAAGGLALMGGGANVDAAFAWMGQGAGGGDFVVLSFSRASTDKIINSLATLNSVETLVVPDVAAANDDFVARVVSSAEAVFITGGDQSNYILNWGNTKLETAIYTMLARGGVLGGTSAGLAVLGDVDYSALNDSTTSAEALADPLTSSITLDNTFITPDDVSGTPLRFLQDTITDSHFMQRDRMGRTMAFMARADAEDRVSGLARAIAINEQTALLVDNAGMARVVGNPYAKKTAAYDQQRSAYMMRSLVAANLSHNPLSFSVDVQRLTYDPVSGVGDTFDLAAWSNPLLATPYISSSADHYKVVATPDVANATSVLTASSIPSNATIGIYGPILV